MEHTPSPLSLSLIQHALDTKTRAKANDILIFDTISSTNDALWQQLDKGRHGPLVCLSETQTAGRGRRGDLWHSPAVGNLYLSILWPFPADMTHNGLSIAIGISLIQVLKAEGINDLQLKWPNDILHKRKKLAGILVESRLGTKQNTVVGIGLNFKLPPDTQNQIQQPTTSLEQLCKTLPCRNRLAGTIIQTMITLLERFQDCGLNEFLPQWQQYDALANQHISLVGPDDTIDVIPCGINQHGELRYLHNDKLHTLSNSHISIRFNS
ncbi:MAG: biotin--[acetyl-CoA-carboxylase] ligase [Gammaproteobacteria bacterium]|nr:biotin--[acetyl-CoA-carboxylase] ligase [Gammaproteobacteria bacterium]